MSSENANNESCMIVAAAKYDSRASLTYLLMFK